MIFALSAGVADMAVIRCRHRFLRRAASASAKLAVCLWRYQGRVRQLVVSAWVLRYQHQMAVCSHSDSAAARAGPWPFQDWGSSPPMACLASRLVLCGSAL